ncbi:MAG TPA: hypothetical protein VF021_05710 [Longimicrobiales bacterium]
MLKLTRGLAAIVVLAGLVQARALAGQTPQPVQQSAPPLEVGATAPDFELPAATRYGLLRDAVQLSDFKGKTVVLAFFFKARTKG